MVTDCSARRYGICQCHTRPRKTSGTPRIDAREHPVSRVSTLSYSPGSSEEAGLPRRRESRKFCMSRLASTLPA